MCQCHFETSHVVQGRVETWHRATSIAAKNKKLYLQQDMLVFIDVLLFREKFVNLMFFHVTKSLNRIPQLCFANWESSNPVHICMYSVITTVQHLCGGPHLPPTE